jgi:hypothetical protein
MENESNKTAIDQMFDIIEGLAEYSPENPLLQSLLAAKPRLKEVERNQHGDTWDAAIQAHEDRGHVLARSICDFDNYFNETYENKN